MAANVTRKAKQSFTARALVILRGSFVVLLSNSFSFQFFLFNEFWMILMLEIPDYPTPTPTPSETPTSHAKEDLGGKVFFGVSLAALCFLCCCCIFYWAWARKRHWKPVRTIDLDHDIEFELLVSIFFLLFLACLLACLLIFSALSSGSNCYPTPLE